jgi:hypothetical protein
MSDLHGYEALYASIRRNDPATTKFQLVRRGRNHVYGRLLGEALQGNTHVSHLSLLVSMEGMKIAPVNVPPHHDHIAPLLSYIRSGPALRDVRLKHDWSVQEIYVGYLIDAVADSPFVVNFTIERYFMYPPQSMGRLLTTNMTVKRLDIPVIMSADNLSNALASNDTIQDLMLGFEHELPEAEAVRVICSLQDHQSLQKLGLLRLMRSSAPAVIGALSSVLPSLLRLADLSLEHDFRLDEMELLLEGLAANQSIVKLSLSGDLVQSAAAAFAHYMQTQNGVSTNGITVLRLFLVRRLGSESCDADRLIADLLKARGSGLRSFQLNGRVEVAGIWDAVANNKMLTFLTVFGHTNTAKCFQVLPELIHLRELQFRCNNAIGQLGDCEAFCHAMKKNACLHKVLVTPWNFVDPRDTFTPFKDWDDNVVRQLKAWGKRNRLLPMLLAKDPSNPSSDHGDVKVTETSILPLVPTLLYVAQQTPRMAPNHLLQGLLALKDLVCPKVQKAHNAERLT